MASAVTRDSRQERAVAKPPGEVLVEAEAILRWKQNTKGGKKNKVYMQQGCCPVRKVKEKFTLLASDSETQESTEAIFTDQWMNDAFIPNVDMFVTVDRQHLLLQLPLG